METALFERLLDQAEQLTWDEQLALAARIVERARNELKANAMSGNSSQTRWLDAAGLVNEPLCLEDAQTWVSRTRQEGDAQRESQWVQPE